MKKYIESLLLWLINSGFFQRAFIYFILRYYKKRYGLEKTSKPRLFWGPTPLINYKFLSKSLSEIGYDSKTVVTHYYSVYKKEDFDIYVDDILASYGFSDFVKTNFQPWILMDYALKHFDVFHASYEGLFLGKTDYWNLEAYILHQCNKKVVLMPYGGDAFMYSQIKNTSQQHALLINYPKLAKNENMIEERLSYWQNNADFCVGGGMIDGFRRWDSLSVNFLSVDIEKVLFKDEYSYANGINNEVVIVHTPNHRGVKGTEFIIKAINDLKSEGLKINLLLLENIKNDEVKKILSNKADILVEQLIMTGYGLSAIEGLAAGLPVISNLEDSNFNQLFSRYSFLGECPIVSSSPEKIMETLRTLIVNPALREELGRCGRKFAAKYHSPSTTQYLFNRIYDRIWYGNEVDIINLFHPLHNNSYNNQSEIIYPPLQQNQLK